MLSAPFMTDTPAPLRDRLRALSEPVWHEWLDDASYNVFDGDEAGLIALATDPELLDAGVDPPDCWVPVHAWRALAVVGTERAVEPLLEVLDGWDGDDWPAQDIPKVLGRIGLAAVPAVRAFGVDPEREVFARMSAAEALERIGTQHPVHRDACVEALSAMLEGFERQDVSLNAVVIGCLVELAATEAAPLMEAAFGAGWVDLMHMGDWEDVQIELGLLDERVTPRPPGTPSWEPGELAPLTPLPGCRDLDAEGAEALGRVFEGIDASGPVRSLRALEGFLFTIACAPEVVQPSQWIEFLLDDAADWASEAEANAVLRGLIALYNEIQSGVNEREFGAPEGLFKEDTLANLEPGAEASQWSLGFTLGHAWLEEEWEVDSAVDKELAALVFPLTFFASRKLAEEHARVLSGGDRSVEDLADTVLSIWPDALVQYASMGREILRLRMAARRARPVRATVEQRIGRNDPCPCGSGRKFKKCCGRAVN